MYTSESTYIYSKFDEKLPFIYLWPNHCDASTPVFGNKNLRNINKLFFLICIQAFFCHIPAYHLPFEEDENEIEFIDV